MLEAALRYPTNGDRALGGLLIGGVLTVLSVFVLPAFLVYGYLVRCLAEVAAGEEAPPEFEAWGDLFVDGLKAFVVALVYGAVPFVLAATIFVPASVVTGPPGDTPSDALAAIGALAVLVLVVVTLAIAFVVVAALTNFAVEGRLGAAFDVGAILRLATSGPYVTAIVLAIVVQVLLAVTAFAAVLLTFGLALFVLLPLGAFIQFWVYLVTVYLFGTAYRESTAAPASDRSVETGG